MYSPIAKKFEYDVADLEKDAMEGQRVENVRFIKENSQFETQLSSDLRIVFDIRLIPWNSKERWIVLVTTDLKSPVSDLVTNGSSKTVGYILGYELTMMNSFVLQNYRGNGLESLMKYFMAKIMRVKCYDKSYY